MIKVTVTRGRVISIAGRIRRLHRLPIVTLAVLLTTIFLQPLPITLLPAPPGKSFAQGTAIPSADRRLKEIRHLDLKYTPREYRTREEWLERAEYLRGQILAASGLLPMPAKAPLNARMTDRIDRGSYTVEKVYFESLPGFYVTGNLYRPKVTDGSKVPAVLCPHGHWTYGRIESSNLNSTPARAANFAMQGYVAFTYDMVGYNDSAAISHRFAIGHREGFDRETLWSVNLLGLQLWNSIRSVDLLLSLPEVDPGRIGVTGESGGGTQTFLLAAIEDRIKISGPVNMISYVMQGGSLCENAPNLRIDTENVEIGALAAPRPMVMISATGDWTRNTWIEEYPATRAIYRLLGAEDKLTTVQINAPHNYNLDSREAVYTWFARWMLGRTESTLLRERGGGVLPATDLLVFYGKPRPEGELDEPRLINALIESRKQQLRAAFPADAPGLSRYRESFGRTFRHAVAASSPKESELIEAEAATVPASFATTSGIRTKAVVTSRREQGDIVRLYISAGEKAAANAPVSLIVDPLQAPERIDAETTVWRDSLLRAGHRVVVVKTFPGGRQVPEEIKFFTTYNRTDQALRVQDILTALAYTRSRYPATEVNLVATGEAGPAALLARGFSAKIDRMIVDTAGFRNESDEEFVSRLPIPGLRRAGDFTTAIALSTLSPLYLYQTGDAFEVSSIREIYSRFGKAADLIVEKKRPSHATLAGWLTGR